MILFVVMANGEKIKKLFDDDKALRECIRKKCDLKKVAKDRGIKLATPV